jgi:hypothetical protein
MGRHDQVVVGQLRTSEWIARNGWGALPSAFVGTTFRSFWAQFGWMAVPIDARIYTALAMLSGVATLGFVVRLVEGREGRPLATRAGLLLACAALLTLATHLGYNLSFYQPQGRYLFPALIPLGLAWSLGWQAALRRDRAWVIGAGLACAALASGIGYILEAGSSKWHVAIYGLGAVFLGARTILPERARYGFLLVPYLFLALLTVVSPFWFIVPYLSP